MINVAGAGARRTAVERSSYPRQMSDTIVVPSELITAQRWESLDREPYVHYELSEGVLVMTPRPTPRHQHAARLVANALERVLPPGLVPVLDVEIVLEPDFPGTYRAPDVVVVNASVVDGRPRLSPLDVSMVVEVVSPGSVIEDTVTKKEQYRRVAVAAYLIVDITSEPIDVIAHVYNPDTRDYEAAHGPFSNGVVPVRLPGMSESMSVDLSFLWTL